MMNDQFATPSEAGQSVAPSQPTAAVGTSSTALMGAIDGVRRLVVTVLVLVLIVGVGLGAALVLTRQDLATANDRIAALTQAAAQAAQAQQQGGQAAAGGQAGQDAQQEQIAVARPLEGVDRMPSGADASGALLIGNPDAANVVELFVDFQCPYCQRWEGQFGDAIVARTADEGGDLLVKLFPLAFLKETDVVASPGASARASNAAACIADSGETAVLNAFMKAVYASADPSEPDGQFPTEQLIEFATTSGANDQVIACIEDQRFLPYVQAVTQASFARGVGGTPTVIVNGDPAENPFTDESLIALLSR